MAVFCVDILYNVEWIGVFALRFFDSQIRCRCSVTNGHTAMDYARSCKETVGTINSWQSVAKTFFMSPLLLCSM